MFITEWHKIRASITPQRLCRPIVHSTEHRTTGQKTVHKKFGVIRESVEKKRIILIDDSIVRGNTMSIIVSMLRACGAKEVHLRIASPHRLNTHASWASTSHQRVSSSQPTSPSTKFANSWALIPYGT
uniref:Amidophosphoribosyltransferase n=1 Tax=Ascaris suum TaxID=6253 RepID=F1LEV7_ASCSU